MARAHDPYDSVAYLGIPNPQTHPDRMAALAILHGLTPAPVEHCRVLEIACNEGANLIPMAYAIPSSGFVGFDLARMPIARGQERIGDLGLKNVRLFDADLLAVGAEIGRFDYIVAHGLYAWVGEAVRERLLALCGEVLTPDGIAFISYNTFPGGHFRQMIREMMQYRVREIDDPLERVSEALDFVRLLIESRPEGDAYRQVMQEQLDKMAKRPPQLTFHDEFSEAYQPVLFTDFVEHAGRHGLQYVCEAALPPPGDPCYRTDLRSASEQAAGGDFLRQEQMLDFMRGRMYRETLLCRAGRVVRRDYPLESLRKLLLGSQATSAAGEKPGAKAFTLPGGARMESNHGGAIALMERLGAEWPGRVRLGELEPELDEEAGLVLDGQGIAMLMRLIVSKFIEMHAWNPPAAHAVSEQPRASGCARQEAKSQVFATTLLHGTLSLDDPQVRWLLGLLDGTRDRRAILAAMKAEFPDAAAEELEAGLEPALRQFLRLGLLEA